MVLKLTVAEDLNRVNDNITNMHDFVNPESSISCDTITLLSKSSSIICISRGKSNNMSSKFLEMIECLDTL